MAKYNIGGYIFNDENSARKAAKELKAVEYILGQIRAADEQEVLKIYKKILNQKLFSTEVGMSFLNQLYQNLIASDAFSADDIPPVYTLDEPAAEPNIELSAPVGPKKTDEAAADKDLSIKKDKPEKKISKLKREKVDRKKEASDSSDSGDIKRLKLINKFLIVCVFTLLLCVIGMFVVSLTINSPTILNYKEAITDEYASWKQQLDEREKALDAREAELNAREFDVGDIEEGN
ncbi:MAG: hypothetical protein IKW81_05825 [Pseudobutyrivibrio sp.]|nr:hypothetical protein [Pseudobutyrivibrio sp.]